MGSRYQPLSIAFLARLDAALNGIAGDVFVAVPSPAEHPRFELSAVLEALRNGWPFEHLPIGHPVDLLQPPDEPNTAPLDVMSPGAALVRQLEDLRKKMAADPEPIDFDAIRRDTIRAIEHEQRDAARRIRQREKRKRKAERKRRQAAATQP